MPQEDALVHDKVWTEWMSITWTIVDWRVLRNRIQKQCLSFINIILFSKALLKNI